MKPGRPALWGDAFKRTIHTQIGGGYRKLLAVLYTEFGALNRVHVLRWQESSWAKGLVQIPESQQNIFLIPPSFSPPKWLGIENTKYFVN